MKKMIKEIGVIILLGSVLTSALNADALQDLNRGMSNADPSIRASAIQHFINSLGTANGEASMAPALPVLIAALNDPDVKVRQLGAIGLRGIAAETSHIVYPSVGSGPDLTADASTQGALLKATSDSDPTVSRMALQAYALTYKLTPELEQKIIDTFNSYKSAPGQPDDRFALLGSLVNDRSPSPVAVKFIVQKIDDPQFGVTALQSLGSLKKPPTDILPKLLNEAGRRNTSEERKLALELAAKAYGPVAEAQMDEKLSNRQ